MKDVIAVGIHDSLVHTILASSETGRNAEAIIRMAVMRRGVDEEFYVDVPAGSYRVGEAYQGRRDGD